MAIVMLDLDRFKVVNDVLGHEVGDQLLVDAAMVIEQMVGDRGVALRHGGDEFVVVCDRLDLAAATTLADAVGDDRAVPARSSAPDGAGVGRAWRGIDRRGPSRVSCARPTSAPTEPSVQGGGRAVVPGSRDDQDTFATVSGS